MITASRQAAGQWANLPGRLDTTFVECLGEFVRLTGRKKDKADRRAQLWAGKYANAHTPADLAAVEFDLVRAAIDDLPTRAAEKAWKRLAELLARHRESLPTDTVRDVHE